MLVYSARTVVPVASPPVSDGAVAVENGRIAAVGPRADVLEQATRAEVRDLGDAVVIPGLVNAHTHLELRSPSFTFPKRSIRKQASSYKKHLPRYPGDQHIQFH